MIPVVSVDELQAYRKFNEITVHTLPKVQKRGGFFLIGTSSGLSHEWTSQPISYDSAG
jgi:hypothetical protein